MDRTARQTLQIAHHQFHRAKGYDGSDLTNKSTVPNAGAIDMLSDHVIVVAVDP
jgi:hypothetical protein